MIGSWIWNVTSGIAGMVFAFIGAILNNPLITAFERAIYGFVVAFLLMFGVRWFIGTFLGLISSSDDGDYSTSESNEVSGTSFDAETPDELDSLRRLIRDNVIGDFTNAENPKPRREPAASPAMNAPQPGFGETDLFSSFGSVEDLLGSFDSPKSQSSSPEAQRATVETNRPSTTNQTSGMPQGELTAEDLAKAIRTSFLDD